MKNITCTALLLLQMVFGFAPLNVECLKQSGSAQFSAA
jgi:hypothetical protein